MAVKINHTAGTKTVEWEGHIVSITKTSKFDGVSMSLTEVADGTAVQSRRCDLVQYKARRPSHGEALGSEYV
jgi:hypothetical protein